jgi:hypothetical protein
MNLWNIFVCIYAFNYTSESDSFTHLCTTALIPITCSQHCTSCDGAALAVGAIPTTNPSPPTPHNAVRIFPINPSSLQTQLGALVAGIKSRSTTAAENGPPAPLPHPANVAVSIAAVKSAATTGLKRRRNAQITVRSWADEVTRSTPLVTPTVNSICPVAADSGFAAPTADDVGKAVEMRWCNWRCRCRVCQELLEGQATRWGCLWHPVKHV